MRDASSFLDVSSVLFVTASSKNRTGLLTGRSRTAIRLTFHDVRPPRHRAANNLSWHFRSSRCPAIPVVRRPDRRLPPSRPQGGGGVSHASREVIKEPRQSVILSFQRVSDFPARFLIGPRKNKADEKAASQVSGDILSDTPARNPSNQHVEHVQHIHRIGLTFVHVHSNSAKSHDNLDRPTYGNTRSFEGVPPPAPRSCSVFYVAGDNNSFSSMPVTSLNTAA